MKYIELHTIIYMGYVYDNTGNEYCMPQANYIQAYFDYLT